MSSFKYLEAKDNFYQTSMFFPMPVVMISTMTPDGKTTCGPYSLIAPYYIAGKDFYAMILMCRSSSNTAQNLLRNPHCVINFLPDDKKLFKESVRMGWPGDKPEEKMKNCIYHFEDGQMQEIEGSKDRPQVITEAFQAIEATWVKELDGADKDIPLEEGADRYEAPFHNFNGITSPFGAHFILKIDRILMKEKYWNTIVNGVKASGFPSVPVDYGYRDSKNFWCAKFRKPYPEILPQRQTTVANVRYAADRLQTDVKFTDDALMKLVNVPRVFLPTILKACVKWADEHGVKLIDEATMNEINDKRSKEKKK